MKRKGWKREQIAALTLAVRALAVTQAAKKSRFSKRYIVEPKYLGALGLAIRDIDPHIQRWIKKNGGKV